MPSAQSEGSGDWDEREQILKEHRELRATLEAAVQCRTKGDLAARLGELRELLVRHFATEEGAGGLHESIREADPRLLARLEPLNREHGAFLKALDSLLVKVSQGEARDFRECHLAMVELSERLHDHEARENEALQISVQRDLGGGD